MEYAVDQEAMRETTRRGHRTSAVRSFFRASISRLFSCAGLFSLVLCYCLLGALLFQYLESEYEMEQRRTVERIRDDCIKELWHITERLNVLYEKNWTDLVSERLRRFETSVVAAAKTDGYDGSASNDGRRQWSYAGALFYSIAVITTVGFGKLAPKTSAGKVVTMVYAVMGVPLMILCLAYLGKLVAHALQFAYSAFCCTALPSKFICPQAEKTDSKSHSALISSSLEEKNQGEDYEDGSFGVEDSAIEDLSKEDYKGQQNIKLPTMYNSHVQQNRSLTLNNVDRSFGRAIIPDLRKHPLECTEYTTAQKNVTTVLKVDVDLEKIDSLELQLVQECHQPIEAEGMTNSEKTELREEIAKQCDTCDEEGNDSQEDTNINKEWTSQHPDTPSRIPLIGKAPLSACSQQALSETKHVWISALPIRPPTPIPNKDVFKNRERWSKCTQESSSLAESDRHLCSTSSLTAAHVSPKTLDHHVPVWLVIGVLCGYICIGGVMFAVWEDLTFLDGTYFCFVTLSTIGFGDFIPGKSLQVGNIFQSPASSSTRPLKTRSSLINHLEDSQEVELQLRLLACCAYLFFGLVLIASSFFLLQEEMIACHQALRLYLGINSNECTMEEEKEEIDESNDSLKEMSFN